MKNEIFKKANKIIEQKKVKFLGFGVTRDILYFEVATIPVTIELIKYKNPINENDPRRKTIINCQCKHHSVNHDQGLICCYTIALIRYMCEYYDN